jgi:hypothetical protein
MVETWREERRFLKETKKEKRCGEQAAKKTKNKRVRNESRAPV